MPGDEGGEGREGGGWRWRRGGGGEEGRLMCLESWVGDICGFRSSILKILAKVMYFLYITRNVLPIILFLTFLSKKVFRKCKFWPNLFSEGRLVFVKHFLLPSVLDKGIDV